MFILIGCGSTLHKECLCRCHPCNPAPARPPKSIRSVPTGNKFLFSSYKRFSFNTRHANSLFLYLLKTEKPDIFCCFQGVYKEITGMACIKWNEVFENWPSEICGRQPLKILKWHDRPYHFKIFKGYFLQISLDYSWIPSGADLELIWGRYTDFGDT